MKRYFVIFGVVIMLMLFAARKESGRHVDIGKVEHGRIVHWQNEKTTMLRSTSNATRVVSVTGKHVDIVNEEADTIVISPVVSVKARIRDPKTSSQCWEEVDWGLLGHIPQQSNRIECKEFPFAHNTFGEKTMKYCIFPKDTQIHPLGLKSKAPLHSVKEDGGAHDPRYPFESKRISYECQNGQVNLNIPCGIPSKKCTKKFGETLLISRKDDHNPFFMISILVNAWVVHGKTDVQLLMYDDAGQQPVDDLFKKLLSPTRDIAYADKLLNDVWCFDKMWRVPGEYNGPLMAHLNDKQECGKSQMIESFVEDVYKLYPDATRDDSRPTVTFVGRKHYNGRTVGRVWTNEKEVVDALASARNDLNVRLVYYEDIDFKEQIHIDRTTDIMVGMHGAGLVHALFLPRGSKVVEIFPRSKRRWGYRNIAQYRGFVYNDFRGGRDGAHESKTIEVSEWLQYFNKKFPAQKPNIFWNELEDKPLYTSTQVIQNPEKTCSEEPQKLQGMMEQTEQTFLKTFIKSDSTYFEWGSGGSTDTFGRLTTGKIVSVENYQPWCDKVAELPFVKCRQKFKSMDYKCIVPYPTQNAGYPVDDTHNGEFDEYIEAIKDYPDFDIVLVDGRWRVACALFALDYIKDETVVFIHDFGRKEYHVVHEWYNVIEQVGALVALKRKKEVVRPSTDILHKYKRTPGP